MDDVLSDAEWKTLLTTLRSDAEMDEDDLFAAAERLSSTSDPARVPDLYALLREKGNFWLRELAAEPLANLEGVRALPALFEAQQLGRQEGHDNDTLNFIIVELLESQQQDAVRVLLYILSDRASSQRGQAVWGLSFLPKELSLGPLLQALKDYSPEVREEAARGLSSGTFADPETVSALVAALRDPERAVRLAAAYSLGCLSGTDAVSPELARTLRELPGEMGDAARQGLVFRMI